MSQETKGAQTAPATTVPAQEQAKKTQKKAKSHKFAKFFSILFMLCFVVGLFLPVYIQSNGQTGSGSILAGEQTIFAFVADALKSFFSKEISFSEFLTSASANRMIWWVAACTVIVFFMTVITFFSKKHTRGWFFLNCLCAALAIYPYNKTLDFVTFVKTFDFANFTANTFPPVDLILAIALLAALFAAIMALFCFLRALFSSKKRAICAILCFFASAALLVYSYPYKDIAVTSGIYYFAEIGYTMAKGLTVVVYLTEATAYAATIALLINLLAEAWRIAKGKKVGGFTVFRYTILLIVSVAAWILPAFATQPFALPVSPALWIAVASIVMFAFNIIAASHNAKKKKAAEAAAAAKKAQEKKQTTENASAAKEGKK